MPLSSALLRLSFHLAVSRPRAGLFHPVVVAPGCRRRQPSVRIPLLIWRRGSRLIPRFYFGRLATCQTEFFHRRPCTSSYGDAASYGGRHIRAPGWLARCSADCRRHGEHEVPPRRAISRKLHIPPASRRSTGIYIPRCTSACAVPEEASWGCSPPTAPRRCPLPDCVSCPAAPYARKPCERLVLACKRDSGEPLSCL